MCVLFVTDEEGARDINRQASLIVASGILRYALYASLLHRPSSWIVDSDTPAAKAAEAPPIGPPYK